MNNDIKPKPWGYLWQRANQYCNVTCLWILRTLNAIIFLAIVFYIGDKITGWSVLTVITVLSIFWGGMRGYNADFIMATARKIFSFELGVSLVLFVLFAIFLFHFRWAYLKNLEELKLRLWPKTH